MRRFTSTSPCPICGGHDHAPRGKGVRCFGYLSDDGEWAFCTRQERAGKAPYAENAQAWRHNIKGPCPCGKTHAPAASSGAGSTSPRSIAATYDYYDEGGQLLMQVVKTNPKGYFQRRPDGRGGWINSTKGVRRVPYRLRQLLTSDRGVVVVEGEKDADRLCAEGLMATTCPGGAGKWRADFNKYFAGRNVYILPDNDQVGKDHAVDVARSLQGTARGVRIVELPGLVPKGDVSDWLDAGGTINKLRELAAEAPEFAPLEQVAEEESPASTKELAGAARHALLVKVIDLYRNALKGSSEVLAALEVRGIDSAVADRWQLGWAPEQGGAEYLLNGGIARADAIDSHLLLITDDGEPTPWCSGRVVIPFIEGGAPVHLVGISLGDETPRFVNLGGQRHLFNASALNTPGGHVVAVQSPLEVIRLSELGNAAVALCVESGCAVE